MIPKKKLNDDFLNPNQFHDQYVLKARSDEAPHIFAVADRAWQDMLHHKVHQNILLAGDRQSGKSYNFVQLIRHFCYFAKVSFLWRSTVHLFIQNQFIFPIC